MPPSTKGDMAPTIQTPAVSRCASSPVTSPPSEISMPSPIQPSSEPGVR
jgi:hypothetical protein